MKKLVFCFPLVFSMAVQATNDFDVNDQYFFEDRFDAVSKENIDDMVASKTKQIWPGISPETMAGKTKQIWPGINPDTMAGKTKQIWPGINPDTMAGKTKQIWPGIEMAELKEIIEREFPSSTELEKATLFSIKLEEMGISPEVLGNKPVDGN